MEETGEEAAPAVVLVEPQMGENIGAAARAMANFGLGDLRLVRPRDGWPSETARANAASATHVIDAARVFADLDAALADTTYVLATTARQRGLAKPVLGPREGAGSLRAAGGRGVPAVLFGRERAGLTSEEVARAEAILTFPVMAEHASLNLGQAVLLVAYEWRAAAGARLPFARPETSPPARQAEIADLFAHLEDELDAAGFFRSPEKRSSMVLNLRAMLMRIGLTHQDVQTLRGLIAALSRRPRRPPRCPPGV